ncbi:kinesin-like protein KIF19 isoform X2 [Dreissena polymorpha]|uniref:kinesin-like protein KIF19 isoform X2 n=1 Tax=Dreissena polymorpha TaxID=45954 RepID=UPI00226518AE|nr:kinesin-like protein KIF19 isoform X2 [Dreissena polymorpha]
MGRKRNYPSSRVTVCTRIRPMNEDEILFGATCIAHKVEDRMLVLMDPMEDPEDILRANRTREKQFVFDTCFDGSSTQEDVYKSSTKFLIDNVVTGYNATVFAYGATGAGKTYTMLGTDDDPGIMARTLNDLFISMEKTREDMKYKVTLSYLEIYNEMIRDLLSPSSGILDLREDAKGGIQVAGLSEVKARSTDEVMRLLLQGNTQRTQEPTAANKTSSRSHAVLQVIVRQQNRVKNTMQEVRTGKLFLIDLAGSERAANTHNRGKRMVEGAHINRSLLALGNCINALTDKNGKGYVNYRDSKLTRLLKDALGGNCKTVMIAHISPASIHFEESRNTLVYADRAKHIKTKVRRNVTDVAYHIAQYTNIIQELRDEINRLRHRLNNPSTSAGRKSHIADIQSVQSEVLEAKRSADREELNKIKEQLLISFKDQMELRKSLMELNNATMEISLETNRNQMIISEWEVELARQSKARNPDRPLHELIEDHKKALDVSGTGTDEIEGAEDVRTAREELKVLHEEKRKTEKLRITVKKELEAARMKTRKLEETIPQRVNSEDQKDVLRLLCKVHALEIQNTEVQSSCLLKDYQIKKKDMVIARFRQHKRLCDQIIRKQKNLIEENNLVISRELEELIEMYRLENTLQREDSDLSVSSDPTAKGNIYDDQLSTLTEESEPTLSRRQRNADLRRTPNTYRNSDERLFSQTPMARGIENAKFDNRANLSAAWRNNSSLSQEIDRVTPPVDASGDRTSLGQNPSRNSFNDRHTILSNTRNIAALAAKKRNKAQTNLTNIEKRDLPEQQRPLYRPNNNDNSKSSERETYLSPSRLDTHNRTFIPEHPFVLVNKVPSEDSLSLTEKQTLVSERSLPPLRRVAEANGGDRNRNVRQWVPVDGNIKKKKDKAGYTHQFLKKNHGRQASKNRPNGEKKTSRTDPDKDFDSLSVGRRRIQKGPQSQSDSSSLGTPMNIAKSKRPPPTIPGYKKGDITITGFSLPRY